MFHNCKQNHDILEKKEPLKLLMRLYTKFYLILKYENITITEKEEK